MKNTQIAAFAISVALSYSSAAGVCQSLQGQPEIRFRLVRNTVIVISLMANDQGPFAFVFDTGADTTIVDPSLASKLSLVPLRRIQQTTLAGVQALPVSLVATLAAGPAHANGLPVLIQDLSELRKLDPHIEGIVGQDFLSHFNYLLDYRKRCVRFERDDEIRSAIDGDHLAMERSDHRMIVPVEMRSGGVARLRLLLDSGANSLVLMRKSSQALNLPAQANGMENTSSGQAGVQVGTIQTLTVGSQEFRNISVAVTASEATEQIGDGLLPMALFRVLYINNREGFVVFNLRPRED
jgi:predicted aspartyl protease